MAAPTQAITDLIPGPGRGGICLPMVRKSACIPRPCEIVMPSAGHRAATGRFNLGSVRTRLHPIALPAMSA